MPLFRPALGMEWLPSNWCPSVVVIDIDGTITDGKKHLSTEAVKAVRRLEDAGIPVCWPPVPFGRSLGLWRFWASRRRCCEMEVAPIVG